MTFPEFEILLDETITRIRKLVSTKGKEYANSEKERLANFYEIGKELDVTPIKVLAIYVKKHCRAIDSFCRIGNYISNESIESRIVDRIVYDILLLGLIKDMKKEKKNARRNSRASRKSLKVFSSKAKIKERNKA